MTVTVMLIHGAWLTPSAWDRFRQRFEAAGMTVAAPPWPYCDRPIDALRSAPDARLARLGLRALADHYAGLVEALPHPAILIGHGFGGLIVQMLLDRGLGAAGVAIGPAPPFGVLPHPRALWASLPVFTAWNGWNRVLRLSARSFSQGFAQTLPAAEKPYVYEKFVAPAPGRIFFDALFGVDSRLRRGERAPLLLIAGAEDRMVPAAMVRANYRRQLRSPGITAFRSFPGRSHWLCNERGWEDVADYALGWAVRHAL